MNCIQRVCLPAVAAVFAFATVSAVAESPVAAHQDAAQLKADKAALQRQIKRLASDEARLKSDSAAGRMSSESKDAYEVYRSEQALKGEKKDIAADHAASAQMESDKAALQRQLKRLDLAEARLKADKHSGKLAAESRESEQVYKDQQASKREGRTVSHEERGASQLHSDESALKRQITRVETDEARLKADTASGKMSAESKDAYKVYKAKRAVKGERKALATDEEVSLQMDSDKAALQRQLKRLELAEARLSTDKASGKMAGESKDAEKTYKDQEAIKGEKKDFATDRKN